ncbi:MAG: aldehyde dehydrogenase (NADP(+)) [Cupriavidus sp.]|uniref:aldehyde dehydrogenase (NADP(+)) n=1 Tax=Cupriavidus pauculus TaxID=82633 RepID=UPI000C5D980E|nr:aldehyde dehydrogenase (NADP(+)) [Cupriavidus pauculus]KAB0604638.1 aldehyde dehydrogenase (NADP(+)) [Cupriavidus pauculus]MBU68199.1 aldehyde dehydrogenase (NADP(+)) [Cupriavidus sp.]MCM3607063.1 aldehyde dehydrogenase (NADP(+)) [Cupriavidus pauculus]UAK98926.1 aldehyde dehydrogenase (NADP(+)) [Cupriavidus pauculus]
MTMTGEMLIGASAVRGTEDTFHGINPATGEKLEPAYQGSTAADVERACALAEAAFDTYRATSPEQRATFLESIAAGLEALGDELIQRAHAETALPLARLQGERGRTAGQLRLFARVLRDGRWQGATLDSALPERTPPRPDLRMQRIAVGPVAVFGASNFPLAFSVAGGDTASALAAGCPVVAKAHPAHPGTSELVGRVIQKAVADAGLPEGVFSMVQGVGNAIGTALVAHPVIQAVGFTGSRAGGLALLNVANNRPVPIPVYAEMSSINPVYLLPEALAARGEQIARDLVDSLVMGVGQFCTNPGLLLAIEGPALETFRGAAHAALTGKPAATMLTPGIHQAFERGVAQLSELSGLTRAACGIEATGPNQARPVFFETSADQFIADHRMHAEVFGPSTVLVVCKDADALVAVTRILEGQLTATVQADQGDHALAARLLPALERKVGRVLFNGYPTGVEVSFAMVHGGPFPATSDTRTTSVGATALDRFLRPVCYQNVPANLLPEALKDGNPLKLWRLKDGELGHA